MALISIAKNSLRSQVVRDLIGERTIDIFTQLTSNESDEDGGLIGSLFSFGKRLVGFLVKAALNVGRWLLRNLWDIVLEASFEIAYFDWNQTDQSLVSAINSNNVQIAGAAGQLLGSGSVWLAAVAVAGLATIKFPVIAGKVMLDLAQEGGEEIRAQVQSFLGVTRNAVTRNVVLASFLSLRKLRLFGFAPISEPREPWTIAGEIQERVENIDNDALQAFVENFLEGAVEAIIEAGYVVSYSIEDYYRSQKMANENLFGTARGVKLQPDENNEDEFVVLTGPQTIVKSSIETAIASHRFIHNRDVGPLVGYPAEDWLRAGIQRRKMTIVYKSKAAPPWINAPGQGSVKEITITIPDAKTGLTWEDIKAKARPFTWGKYRATANLDNARQMALYGGSPAEAENTLREFISLSTASILTLSVTEEKDRHPDLRKAATMVYPAYATLLVRRGTAETTGLTDLSGNDYKNELRRMELWTSTEPPGSDPFL